jgi:hypothetical protein
MRKEEFLKHCQDFENFMPSGEDCNVDCYGLFEELETL